MDSQQLVALARSVLAGDPVTVQSISLMKKCATECFGLEIGQGERKKALATRILCVRFFT